MVQTLLRCDINIFITTQKGLLLSCDGIRNYLAAVAVVSPGTFLGGFGAEVLFLICNKLIERRISYDN